MSKYLSDKEKSEASDLNNLLYLMHTTPIMDKITLSRIATETAKDPILTELKTLLKEGKMYIPKSAKEELKRFAEIMGQITITGNGILLKDERIVITKSLKKKQ